MADAMQNTHGGMRTTAAARPPADKWRQHFTLDLPRPSPGCVWVHACSMGEVGSVAPLIRWLLSEGQRVHLSVVTRTGFAHGERLFGDSVSIAYLPWDLPGLMPRFIRRLRPALLLLTETEFWPGMLGACRRQNIPVIGINTRISDRSFPRYRASRALWRRWLGDVRLFLPQSDTDAERLAAIGIDPDRIRVAGNLKYAITPPEVDASALRQRLDTTRKRPILLVASTHADEESRILAMWPEWKQLQPELLLVIVPRHPERFDAVADAIDATTPAWLRWSSMSAAPPQSDIILIDAMGVLQQLYCIADIAVIGGSLADVGGHNPLEAAVCGRGVVTGPHVHNFRDVMQEMQAAGGAIVASDDNELQAAVARLLQKADELRQLNAHAALFMQDKGAVLPRLCDAIAPWLPGIEE
jgi:3-deoxy-D-manno-octulosonic-acid transferase